MNESLHLLGDANIACASVSAESGVAMVWRLLKEIGLFYTRALQKRPISFKRDLYFEEAYKALPPPCTRTHSECSCCRPHLSGPSAEAWVVEGQRGGGTI